MKKIQEPIILGSEYWPRSHLCIPQVCLVA